MIMLYSNSAKDFRVERCCIVSIHVCVCVCVCVCVACLIQLGEFSVMT